MTSLRREASSRGAAIRDEATRDEATRAGLTDERAVREGLTRDGVAREGLTRGAPVRLRVGLAMVSACTTAVAAYAILRIVQSIVFDEADPALVLWSEHAGFFWRALTAGYIGGTFGFLAWVASARHAARLVTISMFAVPASSALLTIQSLLVP